MLLELFSYLRSVFTFSPLRIGLVTK